MFSSKRSSRQGALRTVWRAAQSHNKLKKSQYEDTDICKAIEQIMYPEEPIAMRMSSVLLLGVVQIYSKQVEYLLRDFKILLKLTQKVALTDANPKTSMFNLDALDMETVCNESLQDNHRKHPIEITVEDSYAFVSFSEDVRNSLSLGDYSLTLVGASIGAEHPDPSNHVRVPSENNGPLSYPRMEIRCDPSLQYFSENDIFRTDQSEDRLEPDWALMEMINQTETDTLADELVLAVSPPSPEQHQQPTSVISEQGLEFWNSDSAYGHRSPTLEIHSTQPPQQTLPEQRIRNHRYDDHITILSNRIIKKRINDSSDILRIRKICPRDALGIWKFNKRIKRDAIFFEPLLTGMGSDLSEAFQKDFSHSPNIALSSPSRIMPSPTGGHDFTPAFGSDTSSLLDQVEATCGCTSDLEASTVTPESDKLTPVIFFKGRPGVEDTFGPDARDLRNSEDGDLSFLAEDNNGSSGPQETTPDCFLLEKSGKSEAEPLSARTRAVAKFIKSRSLTTPVLENQSRNVSLNAILEGKRRKVCARMVFEMLVLKKSGLVDVHQEDSFGDVTVIVTPKLGLFST